jgi:hypothetical protein
MLADISPIIASINEINTRFEKKVSNNLSLTSIQNL